MSVRTATRPLVLTVLLVAGWLVAAASSASARVAPDPSDYQVPAQVLAAVPAPEGLPLLQYALVAAAACLVTLGATLVVQATLRRTSGQHVVAGA